MIMIYVFNHYLIKIFFYFYIAHFVFNSFVYSAKNLMLFTHFLMAFVYSGCSL